MKMHPAPILQNIFSTFIKPVLCSLIFMLLGTGFAVAAEIDDSSLFIDAFTAYQKQDYLLAIEKIEILNQLFPDTPLRDVSLLLLARSGLKSGNNELAATTINCFNYEFTVTPLKSTIEDELLRIGIRGQNGETLLPIIPLHTAAQKRRNEQLALEKSAAEKYGQQQMLQEQERLAMEKTAQEAIRASIDVSGTVHTIAAGLRGVIPFEVANLGPADEDFLLETSAPSEYETTLAIAGKSDDTLARVTIGTATPLKGSILFRMPSDKIDGQKTTFSLRAVSEKYHHVVQARETQIVTAAPLVRIVAKSERQRLAPGEQTRYRVTVINAGTLPARELTVRVLLPTQLEALEGGGQPYLREAAGRIIFKVDILETGKLAEFNIDVKVRENSLIGQELHSKIEVVNNQLQTKELFTSAPVMVVQNPP
jgi:uncharacterized repeat protein (TIGR01451 family)